MPEPPKVDDRVGEPAGLAARIIGQVGRIGHDSFQAADRQGESRDIVMIEDARGHQRPQRLTAAIGQKGDLAGQISRQLVECPAKSVEPEQDPFQPLLMLAAYLLGDDPVLPRGTDVVEVGLHQRLRGDARRGRRQRQPQILDVEACPQPERTHEHWLTHAMNLAQGGPVGVGGNDLLAIDLGDGGSRGRRGRSTRWQVPPAQPIPCASVKGKRAILPPAR